MGCNLSIRKNDTPCPTKQYETLGWRLILKLVNTYNDNGQLQPGWSVTQVDAILSKWVDIPRNITELNLVETWARAILDDKAYLDYPTLQKKLIELRDKKLTPGTLGSSLLIENRQMKFIV